MKDHLLSPKDDSDFHDQSDETTIQQLSELIAKEPNNHEAYNQLGILYVNKDTKKAYRCFKRAVELKPDYSLALYNLANIYKTLNQSRAAIGHYQRALKLDPSLHQAYFNIGVILLERGLFEDASCYFREALKVNPNYHQALTNLGVCLYHTTKVYEAIDYYKRAIELNPNNADAHFNLSLALLIVGDLKRGWDEYRWRWKLPNFRPLNTDKPLWNGQDLKGKTLYVYSEQGYGDTIQFVRYLNLFDQRQTTIKFACPDALVDLIRQSFPQVEVYCLNDPLIGDFDFHAPLMELPSFFTPTLKDIPSDIAYLNPSCELTDRFKALLTDYRKLKVGLAWQGSKGNIRGSYRSIDIRFIEKITSLKGVQFISLLKEPVDSRLNIIDLSGELRDFHHTAALIANLDLVITIDTAVAHLAGAIGKAVWLMLHYSSDWRWMFNRYDSPWYPTMRIFRQRSFDDWRDVISAVADELSRLTSESYDIDINEETDIAHAQINWDKALDLLKGGFLKSGWQLYEWRRYIKEAQGHYPDFGLIEWKGQDLQGKGIMVYDEQGFGDTIQFVRFTEHLLVRGARVYLLCRKELFRLLQTFNPEIEVLQRGVDFTVPVDYISPLMSLPLHLHIVSEHDLAHRSPYLEVNPTDQLRWNSFLKGTPFKVGIAINSSKTKVYALKNSVPSELMTYYLDIEGIVLFNLQKGSEDLDSKIIDPTDNFSDFYDTASFMVNLDLVISIDTAIIHLAGALGKEAWLMLPYESEWRWFDDTERTVWYPTVRIFKQTKEGDWQGVLERIKKALLKRLHGR